MIIIGTGRARSNADPERFFARWIDHASWSEWSPDTEWARVDGPVVQGATGMLKPRGGPKTGFVISTLREPREYTDMSSFPGARLVFQHTATVDDAGTDLAVTVSIHGPLAWLWAAILGRGFRDSAQRDLDRLVTLIEADG